MEGNIKVTELMYGNILHYDTAEGDTLPTMIDWQDMRWCDDDNKGFNLVHSPIKLTEDWLVKFGFEIQPFHESTYLFSDNEYFQIDTSGSIHFENNYTAVDVKYVHQLQNLYFALTGTHLTLNQPTNESKINHGRTTDGGMPSNGRCSAF